MAGWELKPFGELLCEPVRNGIYKPKEFHGRGCKIVNMGELFAFPRLSDVPMRQVDLSEDEQRRFDLKAGDLLFARRSLVPEGAGKCCVVLAVAPEGATFESSIIRARPDRSRADSLFAYYFFCSPLGTHELGSIRRQVAVSGITGTDLMRLHVPVPSLREQQRIVRILGALDDKIELHRRTNETLEAMEHALFKSWFVDFEPVRAKLEGRRPVGMGAETASLFPSAFEGSALGCIPMGWSVEPLSEAVEYIGRGLSPSYVSTGGIAVLNQKCVRGGRLDTTRARRHDPCQRSVEGRQLRVGDILVNSTGVGTLGRVAQVDALEELTVVDSHVTVVRAASSVADALYLGALLLLSEAEIEALGEGSTGQTELSRARLGAHRVLIPSLELQYEYAQIVRPLRECMVALEDECRTLVQLRDTLLPKLLSGELRVPAAESIVGKAL